MPQNSNQQSDGQQVIAKDTEQCHGSDEPRSRVLSKDQSLQPAGA